VDWVLMSVPFSRLEIDGYKITCLPWLTPLPKETIIDYAKRMSEDIKSRSLS
jgi:hypothetical protein